jgi:hypothetical protein
MPYPLGRWFESHGPLFHHHLLLKLVHVKIFCVVVNEMVYGDDVVDDVDDVGGVLLD